MPTEGVTLYAAEAPADLFQRAAARVMEIATARLKATQPFAIALGGGSTPKGLFDELVHHHRQSIDWSRVLFFWGDERPVGPADADSNFGMAHRHLLAPLGITDAQVFRLEGERADLDEAARDYESQLKNHLPTNADGIPVLDLVLLGMGPDGHTASLFPATQALAESSRWVVANAVPQLDTHRLTMTYPLINAAREVQFLIRGEGKAAALQAVLEGPRDVEQWPSQGITAARVEWWVGVECTTQLTRTEIQPVRTRR